MHVAPLSMCAFVSTSSAAKWKYVKIVCPFSMRGHSTLIGSFTFRIMSAPFHVASASGAIFAARLHIEIVGKAAALARALLDEHRVPVCNQRFAAGRHERDTILVRLDLFRDTDTHERTP